MSNILGIILNIFGTILLSIYGFPQPNFNEGIPIIIEGPEADRHELNIKKQKRNYKIISVLSLILIQLGLLLQIKLIST